MTSRRLLDAELAAALENIPPFENVSGATLANMRALLDEVGRLQRKEPLGDDIVRREERIPGPPGTPDVRIVTYRNAAQSDNLPAYLHIHGGGLVMGVPEIRHAACVATARAMPCLIASVDYRLAPDFPYPAAVEDCYAALRWLHENARALGIDRDRVIVGGESAGGGLAAALAILARDRGQYRIRHQMLTYPMLDDRTDAHYAHEHVGEFVWTRANNEFGWKSYLRGCPRPVPAYAAAARCEDLRGLPPTFIAAGALDLFLEEDVDFARRLIRAGVPTELHIYAGAFHAFDIVPEARVSLALKRDWRDAFGKALAIS